MGLLDEELDRLATEGTFSGVVRVDHPDRGVAVRCWGFADRRHRIPAEAATRFAIASGTKGLTALTVMSLVETGDLDLATPVRSLLGADLPLIDDAVTIEHLLAHRSGIGDYLDESVLGDINDYPLPVPVQHLAGTENYRAVLGGHRQISAPGHRFAYNNGGFVVLALLAERAARRPFEELVVERVCGPANMTATRFNRSDRLGPGDAVGYLDVEGFRTNVFHLPVMGSGDGGVYSTAGDVHTLWTALFEGRIVGHHSVRKMVGPHSDVPSEGKRYGLGFWLHANGPAVSLEGYDAGVSFRSVHDPTLGLTHTVLANTSAGAWPISRHLDESLGT
ncbi:MAG: beta-lactamase family protein [Actinomycetia bacterium]|nr:beta-lactamase family protein [Actinomycetes bacterium]